MDHLGLELKLQAVDFGQRIIQGFAAAHSNEDRVKDIIEPAASVKALSRIDQPGRVGVYIGHPMAGSPTALPVGIPLKIEATPQGLFTETYIFEGPVGDNLLHVARGLLRHGRTLGQSIGYQTRDFKMERGPTGLRRRILDYDLSEYSYAGEGLIANPDALVVGVKAMGGGMTYHIEQQGSDYVLLDANGEVEGRFPTRAAAEAEMRRLMREGDEPETPANAGKVAADADPDAEAKAVLSQADQNRLPDSAFLYIEPGGEKDETGRTVPRAKRHFPYKNAQGEIDLPHLRNAIARIPQADVPNKDALQGRARRLLANAEGGTKTTVDVDAPEWQDGAVPKLYDLAQRLLGEVDQLAAEQKAMRLLGEDTKAGQRIRGEMRQKLRELSKALADIAEWAEYVDAARDGAAKVAHYRKTLDLLDLAS